MGPLYYLSRTHLQAELPGLSRAHATTTMDKSSTDPSNTDLTHPAAQKLTKGPAQSVLLSPETLPTTFKTSTTQNLGHNVP